MIHQEISVPNMELTSNAETHGKDPIVILMRTTKYLNSQITLFMLDSLELKAGKTV